MTSSPFACLHPRVPPHRRLPFPCNIANTQLTVQPGPASSNVVAVVPAFLPFPLDMTRSKKRTPGVAKSRAQFKSAGKAKKQRTFYAVQHGRDGFSGILNTWDECKPYVLGVSKAVFKGFKTLQEANAFIQREKTSTTATPTTATPVTNSPKPNASSSASNHHQVNAHRQPPQRTHQYFSMQDTMSNTPKPKGPNNRNHSKVSAAQKQVAFHNIAMCKKEVSDRELFAGVTAQSILKDSPDPDAGAPHQLEVFTDGACSHNGRPNARAGYGVYFEKESSHNISARLKDKPTNQRAEMAAVLEAIRLTITHGLLAPNGTLIVNSDSKVSYIHPISIRFLFSLSPFWRSHSHPCAHPYTELPPMLY